MNKVIKEELIGIIFGDKDNPNKYPDGIDKIIKSVDVPDYQKKRYFVYVCNVIAPVFIGVKDDKGFVDANRIIPLTYDISTSWRGYKIQTITIEMFKQPLVDILKQIFLHIATKRDIKDAENLLRSIEHHKNNQSQFAYILGESQGNDDHLEKIIKGRLADETDDSQATIPKERLENLFKKENLFTRMPLKDVYKHFGELSKRKNNAGQLYLLEDQVLDFIEKAFCGVDHPSIKMNLGRKENQKIYYFFYQYYHHCWNQLIESTQQCRDKYISLLVNNFSNFNRKKVEDSFAKKPAKQMSSSLIPK